MTRPRLVALLLALITLIAYLPVGQHEFVTFDDDLYVSENHIVQGGLTWAGVKWAFTTFHASNWHPLTWLSHMLDCELFGLHAGAHHLVNALFHAASAMLLFILLIRLTNRLGSSAMVAALFAWHPLRVESVAWAAERKDGLSTLLALLTLLAYERYARATKARQSCANIYYGAALLGFACGLLAKPMLVTLPFVMLLLDWWPLRRFPGPNSGDAGFRQAAREKLPFLALSIAASVMTCLAQQAVAIRSLDQLPLTFRLGNAVAAGGQYLWKTIWPANLAVVYPLPKELPIGSVAAAALALVVLSWLFWRARGTCPGVLMGWLWFFGMLVPVIGLVQVGGQAMADRYTYLPHIGLFIAAVYGIQTLASRWQIKTPVLATVAGVVLAACLATTQRQLRFWQNSESLFRRTLEVTKSNPIAHINLGVAFQQEGKSAEALIQFREALRADPNYVQAHNNLAILLDELGENDGAIAEYRTSLRLDPNAAPVHCNFGTLLVKLGRFDEATEHYARAARLVPDDPRPHYLMGKAALRRDQSAMAVAHFRDALRRNANELQTLTFLARVLASDNDPQVRNGQQAVELATQANRLTGNGDPFVLDTLAMAYAETGRFDEAQKVMRQAIGLAKAAGAQDYMSELTDHLKLYEAGQPFRGTLTTARLPKR